MSPAALVLLGVAAGALTVALMLRGWRSGRPRVEADLRHLEPILAAFGTVLMVVDDGEPRLIAGAEAAMDCAEALGAPDQRPRSLMAALAALDDAHARSLDGLFTKGAPTRFEVEGPGGRLLVEGRASGALLWLKLATTASSAEGFPAASRLAALLESRATPVWIAAADGVPVWGNRAFLDVTGADRGQLSREAALAGEARESQVWISLRGDRRALRIHAAPLDGGCVGVWSEDVTAAEATRDMLQRQAAAHERTLDQIGDAIAIFGAERRLSFHNGAFATLWDLEPAWLADGPTHGEILDRLRQRRRLPETVNYARFKTEELARYEALTLSPEAIWRLPDERTLRVVGLPHGLGGLLMVFSDITPELRLKTQFNYQIQVQRATLDKLTDAVAVFGADGRLKLHNEAFERFWMVTSAQLAETPDFEGVVDLCIRRVHDLQFWRDLKGRITDPDPLSRAPVQGEIPTADRRIVAYQSRPLPDGATLISFADVTDTRQLEGALKARDIALREAERLKREFVGSVSYELRTPLTTILGYAELLDRNAQGLSDLERGYITAVRSAAAQLARSINDVLAMAEVDAGEMTLDIEDVDISALLTSAAATWRREAEEAGVTLAAAPAPALGWMRGDPRRLVDVLDHLTQNAIRHTPRGGKVTLLAERALGEVRLQVSDTGRGIPFHVQAHIFDRFNGQGAGLGLALVKALVELHGGWVALESEPGAGATFTCHLPEAAESPEGRPELF